MLKKRKKLNINSSGGLERVFRSVYKKIDLSAEARRARRGCKRQLKTINGGLKGSKYLYRLQVLPFWRQYGIIPRKQWYDLYCYKDGEYDYRYIPEDIYWKKIYPALNKTSFRHAYTDKCFYNQLFPHIKQPRTILRNSNYCFYDGSGNSININQAKLILESENHFVLKPAIYSGEGVDIFFYDKAEDKKVDFISLMNSYKTDYIVQEIASQHKVLDDIHPSSLNTIRVISFLFQGEVHISSSILRMGVDGCRLDNVSTGGLACPILPNGRLEDKATDRRSRWVSRHPGGTVFSDIKIPSYDLVLEKIREMHKDIPHFRIIGWDFSIDEGGEPMLIEFNGAPGLNQISCGPLFGEFTEQVLDEIFLNKSEFSINIATEYLSGKENVT